MRTNCSRTANRLDPGRLSTQASVQTCSPSCLKCIKVLCTSLRQANNARRTMQVDKALLWMKDLVKSVSLRKTSGMGNHTNCRCAVVFQTAVHAHSHAHSQIHFFDVYLLVAAAWLSQALVEVGLQGFMKADPVFMCVCVCAKPPMTAQCNSISSINRLYRVDTHSSSSGLHRLTFTLSFPLLSYTHICWNAWKCVCVRILVMMKFKQFRCTRVVPNLHDVLCFL